MNIRTKTLFVLLIGFPVVAFPQPDFVPGLRHQVDQLIELVGGLENQLSEAQKEIASLKAELDEVKNNTVLDLDGLLSLTQDDNGFDTVLFSGVNVQVVNGTGLTESANGQGNLVLGYNSAGPAFTDRIGSHNLILGDEQNYPHTGQVVTATIASAADLDISAGGDITSSAGANHTVIVGQSRSLQIGEDDLIEIGASASVTVGANLNTTVGGDTGVSVAGDTALVTNGDINFLSEGETFLEVGDELTVSVGQASASLNKAGSIAIDGKDIEIEGTGDISIKAAGELNLKATVINQN